MNIGNQNNRVVLITSFHPDHKTRGPWGERFEGLYKKIYENASYDVIWYSILGKKSISSGSSEPGSRKKQFHKFLYDQLREIRIRKKGKSAILFHYPLFKTREMLKSILFLLLIKKFRRHNNISIILDYVEPPLLMPQIRNMDNFLQKIKYRWINVLERAYLSNTDVIITGGEEMSRYLGTEFALGKETFLTIEQGIHSEVFKPNVHRCKRKTFNVFYAGTLDEDRGKKDLIDCIKRVNDRYAVNLICCGKIQDSKLLPKFPWLHVYSGLNYKRFVEMITEQADLAILPYPANDWWGKISISKLATYLAAGLPVVATQLPHTSSFLKLWDCGETSPNWTGIEKIIICLYQDRVRCRNLGNNARIAAEKALDWENLAKKLENILAIQCSKEVVE